MAEEERNAELTAELIEAGGETVSAIVGGFLGTLGGPPGVVLGAAGGVASARVIKRVGAELRERILAPRQNARAAAALLVAGARARQRQEGGEAPRDDGFFDATGSSDSDAEELLEGTVLKAADAYEQRKVPYMGAFFASVSYRPDISPAYAHHLLRLADRLSYRELVIIAFFIRAGGSRELTAIDARREYEGRWPFADGLGREMDELGGDAGILGLEQADGKVVRPDGVFGGAEFEGHDLGNVGVTPLGRDFYELMELDRIPEAETRGILDLLSRSTINDPALSGEE